MSDWMQRNRQRYPADWPAIAQAVREDAGQCCEECGVPNRQFVVRHPGRRILGFDWSIVPEHDVARRRACGVRVTKVVLTCAHIGAPKPEGSPGDKHDKSDCRRENLRALCQRCHLRLDMEDHIRNAAETRRRRKIEAGQRPLLPEAL